MNVERRTPNIEHGMKERVRAGDGGWRMGGLASWLLLVREMSSMVHVFFGIDLDAVMRYGVSNGLGLIAVADDDGTRECG